ncbi:MAG TPA: dockerin type I domain-containing protein [Pseudobacteroides sp.]|uniref:dockerin type I domain-containing protein n=1 Tax=Pseudobacteroides sp. TaxID=1968840 RepID=UPI002F9518B4
MNLEAYFLFSQPVHQPVSLYKFLKTSIRMGAINMADVMLIIKAINQEKYDPRCDLTNDGAINMADIMKLALKFGYTY